jgi:hypothetical protein
MKIGGISQCDHSGCPGEGVLHFKERPSLEGLILTDFTLVCGECGWKLWIGHEEITL